VESGIMRADVLLWWYD